MIDDYLVSYFLSHNCGDGGLSHRNIHKHTWRPLNSKTRNQDLKKPFDYEGNTKLLHAFVYPETIGGEDPHEVVSLLEYLLKKLREEQARRHHQIIIYADKRLSQFIENYLFSTAATL